MIIAGLTPVTPAGAVALGTDRQLVAACPHERVTRVRGRAARQGWPEETLDLLLARRSATRRDVHRFVAVEAPSGAPAAPLPAGTETLDHHRAHACAAYLTSPFAAAAVVVCDDAPPGLTVWVGEGPTLRQIEWPWHGMGFAEAHAWIAEAVGLPAAGAGQRLEALARLAPDTGAGWAGQVLDRRADGLVIAPNWRATVDDALGPQAQLGDPASAAAAAALQARLGDLFVALLRQVSERTGQPHVCLGGTLFGHSPMTTRARLSGAFAEVFVPADPGDTGLAVGAVLHALGQAPAPVPAFLGPAYGAEESKAVLDNCKLTYTWESDERAIQQAVGALMAGRLVGWFDGPMEWGPRALGARSILANPFAPYVLENLNRFLKHREPWRGYALSGLADAVAAHLDGPARADHMECDYRPKDRGRFAHVLPTPAAAVRVQTVGPNAPPRFHRLLEAFGEASGLPFLVNTSFNGFHEPIVCSPRDAVRVYYGSGLDLLVIEQFVLQK
ncbi:MAG: carbamoyltransferase C-terminal domain-containing protein [Vicinamibacterales bacterium]